MSCPKITQINSSKGMSRRDFLITLGAGTAATISGYFFIQGQFTQESSKSTLEKQLPILKHDIKFGKAENLLTITRKTERSTITCAVNDIGKEIINKVDGKHTVQEISKHIAKKAGTSRTELMDARIAYFITQLGILGFLKEAYHVNIIEVTNA